MYSKKTIAVVIPAYNEGRQIEKVLSEIPQFVDRIIVVNDGSTDNTSEVVRKVINTGCSSDLKLCPITVPDNDDPYLTAERILEQKRKDELVFFPSSSIYNDTDSDRIVLIDQKNSKKGGALANGYLWCRDRKIDCVASMDGDGQMDPSELEKLITPVVCEGVDFVKGNRLAHPSAPYLIPKHRRFGNSVLSIFTKIASGYWNVSDSQTGYIVMSSNAIEKLPLHRIYRDYGCPNDILVKMNIANCTIREVTIRPVYDIGEVSSMKISRVAPRILWLLIKSFFKRLSQKYFKQSFHPLFLFYLLGFGFVLGWLGLLIYASVQLISPTGVVSMAVYITFLIG